MIKYSIIIPVYNEEKSIEGCLNSLAKQSVLKEMEIIVVDDGSTDKTLSLVTPASPGRGRASHLSLVKLLKQNHSGPGAAKFLAANHARGKILVFVDADMEFASDFIEKLCYPIKDDVIGAYSTQELLLNKEKPIARCWNLNFGRSVDKMEPRGYANKPTGLYKVAKDLLEMVEGKKADEGKNKVFRAILKNEFLKVGDVFSKVGYTDDWVVAEKLNKYPVAVDNAVYYHRSPESLGEVWSQARWFGKNEFLTKNIFRRVYNLIRYCPILALRRFPNFEFIKFQLVFNSAVFVSVILSFFNEQKNK